MRSYFSYFHIAFVILWMLYIFCRHRFGRDPDAIEEENSTDERQQRENNENRKQKITKHLKESAWVVKEEDLVIDIESGTEEETIHICTKEGRTITSSECAICLDSYKVKDTVVWSTNSSCPHVYHESCVAPWLIANKDSCCPTCRQPFVSDI